MPFGLLFPSPVPPSPSRPGGTSRISILFARCALNLAAVSGSRGRQIARSADDAWIHEVFVQVIDELGHAIVHPPRHAQKIKHREMLDQLAQPNAPGVWTNGNAELRRHQDNRQVLVHSTEAAAIDLTEVDRLRLQQLFE